MFQKPKHILFSPDAWLNEEKLQQVSPDVGKFWMDCMCFMHHCIPYGHLSVVDDDALSTNGYSIEEYGDYYIQLRHNELIEYAQPNIENMARKTNYTVDQINSYLAELVKCGVASVTYNGIIYSRRMWRDFRKKIVGYESVLRRQKNPIRKKPTIKKKKNSQIPINFQTFKEVEVPAKPLQNSFNIEPAIEAESFNSPPMHIEEKVIEVNCDVYKIKVSYFHQENDTCRYLEKFLERGLAMIVMNLNYREEPDKFQFIATQFARMTAMENKGTHTSRLSLNFNMWHNYNKEMLDRKYVQHSASVTKFKEQLTKVINGRQLPELVVNKFITYYTNIDESGVMYYTKLKNFNMDKYLDNWVKDEGKYKDKKEPVPQISDRDKWNSRL